MNGQEAVDEARRDQGSPRHNVEALLRIEVLLMSIQIRLVESAQFGQNSYVVWRPPNHDAFVIDPGFEPEAIEKVLKREQLNLVAIVCTHGHVDHIAGNADLKQAYPDAPILIGRGDANMLTDPNANLSAKWGFQIVSPPADRLLDDDERISVAGIELEVREIPGHSPGHVVFIIASEEPPVVLGGDVLFAGSVGRTDFPGGSFPQLKSGIEAKLWPLPDLTRVYPGHGPMTTIGEEKQTNPFVGTHA
jgi:hydroxyacylglutathione hydrolase